MSDAQVNQEEWNNPQNWNGRLVPGLYFSKRDSRLWVPKRLPYLGWTINLGHPGFVWAFAALALLLILVGATAAMSFK